VIYLQDVLDDWLGAKEARVILPITDPYVVHHGALGSFATIYLPSQVDAAQVIDRVGRLPGIEVVLDNRTACRRFELPEDRVGDVVVVSTKDVVLGTRRAEHDLSGLTVPLRSHGGISEQEVPLLFNRRVEVWPNGNRAGGIRRLRNFDIFELALNRVSAS
jgi:phosphonoacetate hydrolase